MSVYEWARQELRRSQDAAQEIGFDPGLTLRAMLSAVVQQSKGVRSFEDLADELQIQSPALLKPMLQYGLHLGQQAEMVTDSLRALFLEACGYETKVFEFISLEHTNKNKMILAVKRAEPLDPAQLLVKIQELKAFYNIQEHCLETLLQADGLLK